MLYLSQSERKKKVNVNQRLCVSIGPTLHEPRRKKTGLSGFRSGVIQTKLSLTNEKDHYYFLNR